MSLHPLKLPAVGGRVVGELSFLCVHSNFNFIFTDTNAKTRYFSGKAGSFRGMQGANSPCRKYGLCSYLRITSNIQ